MNIVIKFLLFGFFFFIAGFAGYRIYRYFNERIRSSDSAGPLWLNVFLLILVNVILFFVVLVILLKLFFYLKDE